MELREMTIEEKADYLWREFYRLLIKTTEDGGREVWEKMRKCCVYARPAIAYRPGPGDVNCMKRRYQPCEYENCPVMKDEVM